MRVVRTAFLAALAATAAGDAIAAQEPSLAEVLKRAAAYVAEFQRQLSGIVAEEQYDQEIKNSSSGYTDFTKRRLKSDLLLVRPEGADRYVEFRDVFEVDGRKVRDREERLTRLFINPPAGAAGQLQRVVNESARYNIGNIFRTLNTPLLPLAFLHPTYQPLFSFKLSADPTTGLVLAFEEKSRPTLIQTTKYQDLPSRGRFWIEGATGAISRSELLLDDGEVRATVTVEYRSEPTLGFLVPAEMREAYVSRGDRIEGRASYGRFRKFQVLTDEAIKPAKDPGP